MFRRNVTAVALLCVLVSGCEKPPPPAPPGADDAIADEAEDPGQDGPDAADGDEAEPNKPDPIQHVIEIDGAVTKAEIEAVMQDHLNEIRDCYDDALKHPEGLELRGAIVLRLSVAKSGEVTSAMPDVSEFNHPPTERCLAKVAESFVLPKHKRESTALVPFYMNVL